MRVKVFLVPGIWSEKRVLGPAKEECMLFQLREGIKPVFSFFDTFPKLKYNYFSSKSTKLEQLEVSVFMYT